MEENELVGGASVEPEQHVLLLQTEQEVCGIESEFVLEDGSGMGAVAVAVLYLFLHNKVVLVDVGD